MQTVALVGNAPGEDNQSEQIDSCDRVVRINNCFGHNGVRGSRTDELVLINCGGQMKEWLDTSSIERSEPFVLARGIVLPIHPNKDKERPSPDDPNAANYAWLAKDRYEAAGKKVVILPPETFWRTEEITGGAPPSTGLITLLWLLSRPDVGSIRCAGFGFAGWDGHDFDRERTFFKDEEQHGRLQLI